ncbi:MAG: phosphoribosylanthranilate isomerase [Gammaproteobacteria bacterium]|nr:phosphoribosylanthranilate isomerase [Gammaproteobacteria bacterium]MCF6364024.1 phosphoribosylanthranilate isomerase [Gammaproteobacteria bacterium]
MRTRIKICGFTRPDDARQAAALGVDAIGLVFYTPSPRAVDIARAQAIIGALPPFVSRVGLFVDESAAQVQAVLEQVALDSLQFHGDEAPDYCAQFGRPWLKAIRMREGVDLAREAERYRSATGLLLDAYRPGTPGGTGESFAWSRVPQDLNLSIVLAGGLSSANVAEAIAAVRPFAVDLSGGVESAKGIKDVLKMAELVDAVHAADGRRKR